MKTTIIGLLGLVAMGWCTSCGGKVEGSTVQGNMPVSADQLQNCASLIGIGKIVCLSNAFKAQLTDAQLATLQRDYSSSDAQKWSNLPDRVYRNRVGLALGDLTPEQLVYAKAVMMAVASSRENEGWDELQQILYADDYLGANARPTYGSGHFYLAFLGEPSATGTFEIQFGGHHSAFANTFKDGVLVGATPSFRGVEPFFEFEWEGKKYQPLVQDRDALSAMLNGLSESQIIKARLESTFSNILVGPQNDKNFPSTPSGIKCSELSASQKQLVLTAIRYYVEDVAGYEKIMEKYTNELDNTYLAFSGNTSLAERNDYVRLDGPSIWLEYSCQNGVELQGTHPHSIWRDKVNDYGGN